MYRYAYLLFLIVNLPLHWLWSQNCDGFITDAIYFEDFGSGANPGPELPAGTTTYEFGSIGGGNYVVTNTSGLNGPLWHHEPDHSIDEDGYMLLFDASSNPGVFFRTALDNLCPNTTYVFSCFAANIVSPSACNGNSQEPNLRFTIFDPSNGDMLGTVTTGNIPTSSQLEWNEYAITFMTSATLTSVDVEVTNNAPGGCGNDLVIDDFSLRICNPLREQAFDLCVVEGGTVTVGQNTYDSPGVFTDVIPISDSCNDSIIITALTGTMTTLPDIEMKFCLGDSIFFDGQFYSQTTSFIDTLPIINNCPQFQNYLLEAIPVQEIEQFILLCNEDSLNVGGVWYTEEGVYQDTLQTVIGCDSIVRTIIERAYIDVEISPAEAVLELGEPLGLSASVFFSTSYEIEWMPFNAFSCSDCTNTVLVLPASGTYTLLATDLTNNCMDSALVNIEVLPCEAVYIPNVFSPNYDGVNDHFSVHAKPCYTHIQSLHVFDRWGGLVYMIEDEPIYSSIQLWNGRIDKKDAHEGVYVYQLIMERIDGTTQLLSGDVTLLR